jgi:hypothetical protein
MALSNCRVVVSHIPTPTDPLGVKGKRRTVGTCACGRAVEILYDDTECPCGRCYNLFGQELKSQAQRWREQNCDW